MRVLLINSPLFRERNDLYDEDSLPPIGLGYIATILKQDGIEVQLIDAIESRMPLQGVIDAIANLKPNFLGINIFTTNYELVKELIEAVDIPCHIVVGGLSTKELYSKIIGWETENKIDIVTGDGELIMLDIVRDRVVETPFIEMPQRRVFNINNNSVYLVRDVSQIQLDRTFFSNEPVVHPLGFIEANIIFGRGCIYNCTFCAAARSLNKDYPIRERSSESIIKELSEIRNTFPEVSSIRILDDLFLKSKFSIEKAIEVFAGFSFQWRSMAHVQTFRNVDSNLMKQLKMSGCQELFIGIESGSPKILNSINKTKDIEAVVENLTKVFEAGINMKGYFIYGFPDENEDDMRMTYELAVRLKELSTNFGVNFRTSVFQFRPYHSTQIFHELEERGLELEVTQVAPNQSLSDLVGRLQFNFHSGNYSAVGYQVVEDYIYRTINLNGGNIFSNLRPYGNKTL